MIPQEADQTHIEYGFPVTTSRATRKATYKTLNVFNRRLLHERNLKLNHRWEQENLKHKLAIQTPGIQTLDESVKIISLDWSVLYATGLTRVFKQQHLKS